MLLGFGFPPTQWERKESRTFRQKASSPHNSRINVVNIGSICVCLLESIAHLAILEQQAIFGFDKAIGRPVWMGWRVNSRRHRVNDGGWALVAPASIVCTGSVRCKYTGPDQCSPGTSLSQYSFTASSTASTAVLVLDQGPARIN